MENEYEIISTHLSEEDAREAARLRIEANPEAKPVHIEQFGRRWHLVDNAPDMV